MSIALAATAVAGSALAGVAWSLGEAHAFVTRTRRLAVLPAGSPPVRLLQLSDLHLLPRQHRKISWVRSLTRLQPDLVVSTGDNLAHPEAVPSVLTAYQPFLDLPGVFVLGSNDYYGPSPKNPARYLARHDGRQRRMGPQLPVADLVRGLRSGGWQDLTNQRAELEVRGVRFAFRGVDDAHVGRTGTRRSPGRLGTERVPRRGDARPYLRTVNAMTDDGVALLFAVTPTAGSCASPGWELWSPTATSPVAMDAG